MIEVRNLCRSYYQGKPFEVVALRGVNLVVNDGDMISIMGPSGSGKSTLLHIFALLDTNYTGEYIYNHTDMRKLSDARKSELRNREIGLVMQDYGLIGEMTTQKNVELPLIIAGEGGRNMHEKARKVLRQVGLEKKAQYNVNLLSGGEKQRVAIARAVVSGAKLLLADEPTGAVDSQTTVEILDLMRSLNKNGVTVIIVTHDVAVARMCRRQILIVDGMVHEVSTPEEQKDLI